MSEYKIRSLLLQKIPFLKKQHLIHHLPIDDAERLPLLHNEAASSSITKLSETPGSIQAPSQRL